jgi:hypothetical protein
MPKPTTAAKIAELEKRIEHLDNFARAAIAVYEILMALQASTTETTEADHA